MNKPNTGGTSATPPPYRVPCNKSIPTASPSTLYARFRELPRIKGRPEICVLCENRVGVVREVKPPGGGPARVARVRVCHRCSKAPSVREVLVPPGPPDVPPVA